MGGYLELHPIDWIGRVPAPQIRTTGFIASAAVDPTDPGTIFKHQSNSPFLDAPNARSGDLVTLPDNRFTLVVGQFRDNTVDTGTGLAVDISFDDPAGYFKTTYVQTWHTAPLNLAVQPQPIPLDVPATLTADATDATGASVNGLPVVTSDGTPLGLSGTPFKSILVWTTQIGVDGRPHRVQVKSAPTVSLTISPRTTCHPV